jgi:hypothetical protein
MSQSLAFFLVLPKQILWPVYGFSWLKNDFSAEAIPSKGIFLCDLQIKIHLEFCKSVKNATISGKFCMHLDTHTWKLYFLDMTEDSQKQ